MKHLEPMTLAAPYFNMKEVTALPDVHAVDPLSFGDYDITIKDEFASDDDDHFNDFDLDLSSESDWSIYESPKKEEEVKKNKRKNLVPQRAVQSETSQTGSVGNSSSECSQDAAVTGRRFQSFNEALQNERAAAVASFEAELPEGEDCVHELDDENIFRDLQEETDGDNLDKNILENVKEEWRSHWSIKCNMCEKVFLFKSAFDVHYRSSYHSAPVYTCSFCDRTLEKYSTFRSHCYRHITEGRYKCKECSKGFSLQSLLHVHMLSKHTRAKPFKCEECGKFFVTKPGLKIHVKKHKNEVKEDYPCVECGKVLHTRGGLTSHMNVHRLGRRFMCDVCGKTFTQKVNMQQHVKQHTGDKPHECDKCGKTFAEKSHLARHYSFHSEQRPYKCEVCQKMYKTERCLKVHSMVHAKERPYICTICNKGFLSSTKLKQHYNIHTGERPYACKYCERKFTNYPNWLKHTRRRHNVDHKTGEHLPPRAPKPPKSSNKSTSITEVYLEQTVPKDEPPPTPGVAVEAEPYLTDLIPLVDTVDPLSHDKLNTDFTLSKTDEMLLQQGLINFPVTDDKFFIQQQVDLLASGTGANFLVPYFQNQLPTHAFISNGQSTSQLPMSDFVPVQFI